MRQVTGNLYRNGRSGGFGALQAPATKLFIVTYVSERTKAKMQWRSPSLQTASFNAAKALD
jgi:hypothetical protein